MSDHDPRISLLIAALGREEYVVDRSIEVVWSDIPAYRVVPREQLVVSVRRILGLAVRAVGTGEVPDVAEIWEAQESTQQRLAAGVPIEDVMAGFRVVISIIQDLMAREAIEAGVDDATVLAFTTLLWRLGDRFSARAAAAYRSQGVEIAVADQRRHDDWLLSALAGGLDAHRLEDGRRTYRLRHATYHAFCAAANDGADAGADDRLRRVLTDAGDAMSIPVDGQLVGILAAAPSAVPGWVVALGPPEPLERLASSYRTAQDVLAAALLHYSDGVHTAESLGWRVAVPRAGELTDRLRALYLEPLDGGFGEQVVAALRSYLAHERSIPKAAEALHVHVNTLRYRLARFEELTGRSLHETDVLVELSWVLFAERPS